MRADCAAAQIFGAMREHEQIVECDFPAFVGQLLKTPDEFGNCKPAILFEKILLQVFLQCQARQTSFFDFAGFVRLSNCLADVFSTGLHWSEPLHRPISKELSLDGAKTAMRKYRHCQFLSAL